MLQGSRHKALARLSSAFLDRRQRQWCDWPNDLEGNLNIRMWLLTGVKKEASTRVLRMTPAAMLEKYSSIQKLSLLAFSSL